MTDKEQKNPLLTEEPPKRPKKVQLRKPMPVKSSMPLRKEYTRRPVSTQGIRLDKLSYGTLRRYQYYFNLHRKRPYIETHEELLEAVEEHFANELKVSPVELIYKFLSTKKDPDHGLQADKYFLRGERARNARKEL